MSKVFVGLGSNMGDSSEHITCAIDEIAALPSIRLVRCSSLYTSAPLGPPNQPDYLNAAIQIETALSPLALLNQLQAIERKHGRLRLQKWGKRSLDLDILLYGTGALRLPRLIIPHPCAHLRAFVLAPMFEIDPTLTIPGKGKVSTLLERAIQRDPGVLKSSQL